MKKTALLALVLIAVSGPSMARSYHHRHHLYREKAASLRTQSSHAHITCEMVRAYVAQAGVMQARAMAQAAGMTASEERRAMHCLETGA
jgi:hypothetical protein